jgi:hypothetical protein
MISPEQIKIDFTPVIEINRGDIITNAWDFITEIMGHDNECTNFKMDEIVFEGDDYATYRVTCKNHRHNFNPWVIAQSWRGYETALYKAVDECWRLVNNDGSCKYGIWENVSQLEETLEQYKDDESAEDLIASTRLRLQQLKEKIK